ncbi:hypothetical protein PPBDW_II0748 [Photobacterium kishitanii]|nr:hypothetical protein PPBDW_II0748 [Photobacterium kishitanii]
MHKYQFETYDSEPSYTDCDTINY